MRCFHTLLIHNLELTLNLSYFSKSNLEKPKSPISQVLVVGGMVFEEMLGFMGSMEEEGGGQAVRITAVVTDDAQAPQVLGESMSAEGVDQVVNEP